MDCAIELTQLLLVVALVPTLVQATVETVPSMGSVGAPKEMCEKASKTEKKDILTAYVQVKGSTTKIAIKFSLADCDMGSGARVTSCALAEDGRSDTFGIGLTPFVHQRQKLLIGCLTFGGASIRPIETLEAIATMGKPGTVTALCRGKKDPDVSVITDVTVTTSGSKKATVRIPIIFTLVCQSPSSGVGACFFWNEASKEVARAQANEANRQAVFQFEGKTYRLACDADHGATIEDNA